MGKVGVSNELQHAVEDALVIGILTTQGEGSKHSFHYWQPKFVLRFIISVSIQSKLGVTG